MKFLYLFCFLCIHTQIKSQNVVKTILINTGEASVTTSLPFDRPIILKWISKEPIIVNYAGLVSIDKGNVSDYYKIWAQDNSFLMFQETEGDLEKDGTKLHIQRLKTTLSVNADGKYEANLIIPPLKPNRFYDVKILRKPLDAETSLYFDLFGSIEDPLLFQRKLDYINSIKKPFKNSAEALKEYYDFFLKALYSDVNSKDKDKIAAATAKIKALILYDNPPNGIDQTIAYLKIFSAIELKNDSLAKTEINKLAAVLKGYIKSTAGDYVGDFDLALLKGFYFGNTELGKLVKQYTVANAKEKTLITEKALDMVIGNLPTTDELFVFGQTLSSTTAVLDFDTRTGFTITPDFGYVYYGIGQKNFQGMLPYIGFQLEFRYFDKNIPFNLIRPKTFLHYLSFTSGLSLASIKKEGKRDDFFANKSLLLGLGLRISSATRFTFGTILFRKEDKNPLIDNKTLAATPFIGLSIDLKLKSILNDFYGLTSTRKP